MKQTNLKVIIRRALKSKTISLINIIGLSVGITCTILLASWVVHETSYDRFIPNGDKIYRVTIEGVINGEYINSAQCLGGIGPEAKKLFPEVDNYTRLITGYENVVIKTDETNGFRETGYAADSTFFQVFPFQSKLGDLSLCLNEKDEIVIDEYLATKCFGNTNPVGKTLVVDGHKFNVSAVIKNIPSNFHLRFHFLIPLLNVEWLQNSLWSGDNTITYLKLNNNSATKRLNSEITEMSYEKDQIWKDLKINFKLHPLYDIYFSDFKFDYVEKGNLNRIYIFGITAFLVLLIACINFTNLFIASALKRKRSIGIKLTSGANRLLILNELFVEVVLFLIISFLLAIVLIKTIHPYFISLAGKDINIHIVSINFLRISIPIVFCTLILASIFPWAYLKRLNPVTILKASSGNSRNKFNIQKSLVTVQFIIAIILIFNFLTISKQLNFINNKDLGFNKENILYVRTDGNLQERKAQNRLKEELLKNPNIYSIGYRNGDPSKWSNGSPLSRDKDVKNLIPMEEIDIDKDYFNLMQIEFIEGENVFKNATNHDDHCILNQRAVKLLGLEPPFVDKIVYESDGDPLVVKGIVRDINTKSLRQLVDPCVYKNAKERGRSNNDAILLFRILNNKTEAINAIGAYCQELNPDTPFEYHFLDDIYDKLYKSEKDAKTIITWLTLLAVIITSLGLLAMVLFILESRVKEIGIRKANGAQISEIGVMLNKEFIKWVIIAFVFACPVAWYVMYKWLENFAYKTELNWWIYAVSGLLTLGIALITVSWQSWMAASKNPVEALRYE